MVRPGATFQCVSGWSVRRPGGNTRRGVPPRPPSASLVVVLVRRGRRGTASLEAIVPADGSASSRRTGRAHDLIHRSDHPDFIAGSLFSTESAASTRPTLAGPGRWS